MNTSMIVAMLTKCWASFSPKTSPTMSVMRNSTGTRSIPTETRTPRIVVILLPSVFTIIMEAIKRAKRRSLLPRFFSLIFSISQIIATENEMLKSGSLGSVANEGFLSYLFHIGLILIKSEYR